MNTRNINKLLDKYFAGETTLAEERLLKGYFRGEDIAPAHRPYRPLFQYLKTEQDTGTGAGFEDRLTAKLTKKQPAARRFRLYPTLARIAAVLLVALAAWWAWPDSEPAPQPTAAIDWSRYEPESPEEALQLTRQALARMASELNRGSTAAARELDKVERIGRFFEN